MPASSINLYHMKDAKNNFDAMRPAPVCTDTNLYVGQCQNIHISTNCYYGYHDPKGFQSSSSRQDNDFEMMDVTDVDSKASATVQANTRKRSAEDCSYPQTKRLREEVQTKKSIEPETTEKKKSESNSEDLLEILYWNTHGGNIFHLLQCS